MGYKMGRPDYNTLGLYNDRDDSFYNMLRYRLGSMTRSRYSYSYDSDVHNTKSNSSTKHKLSFSEMIAQDLEQKSKRRTPEEEARIQSQIDAEFRNAEPYGSYSNLQLESWKYKSKKILLSIIFAVYFTVIGFGFAIIIKL